jgi:hypothetical protein
MIDELFVSLMPCPFVLDRPREAVKQPFRDDPPHLSDCATDHEHHVFSPL